MCDVLSRREIQKKVGEEKLQTWPTFFDVYIYTHDVVGFSHLLFLLVSRARVSKEEKVVVRGDRSLDDDDDEVARKNRFRSSGAFVCMYMRARDNETIKMLPGKRV